LSIVAKPARRRGQPADRFLLFRDGRMSGVSLAILDDRLVVIVIMGIFVLLIETRSGLVRSFGRVGHCWVLLHGL
jgi:hypothetical protein